MDYKQAFIAEYKRISPQGAHDYNKRRASGFATWGKVAKELGVVKWLDLLAVCELQNPPRKSKARTRKELTVISHIEL